MNNYNAHQNEVANLKKELSKLFPMGRVTDIHTGLFYRKPDLKKIMSILLNKETPAKKFDMIKRLLIPIKINRPGTPDNMFTITIKNIPVFFYIETKTGAGKQTSEQLEFENYCKSQGYFYILNRGYKETGERIQMLIMQIEKAIK